MYQEGHGLYQLLSFWKTMINLYKDNWTISKELPKCKSKVHYQLSNQSVSFLGGTKYWNLISTRAHYMESS